MRTDSFFTISVAVMAGGAGNRFGGRQKALIPWGDGTLLSNLLNKFSGLTDDLFVISNYPLPEEYGPIPTYPDLIPGKGPLSGIHTALSTAKHPFVLVTACDMPFISPEAATFLAGFMSQKPGKVLVPAGENGPEPLFSIWPCDEKEILEKWLLDNHSLKIMHFLSSNDLLGLIPLNDAMAVGNHFININTADDLESAARLYQKQNENRNSKDL